MANHFMAAGLEGEVRMRFYSKIASVLLATLACGCLGYIVCVLDDCGVV